MKFRPIIVRPTIRLRLSLWYAALFLLAGVLLLSLNYILLRDSFVVTPQNVRISIALRLGIPVEQLDPSGNPRGPMVGNVPVHQLVQEIEHELTAWSLRQLAIKSAIALGIMLLLSLAFGWVVAGRMLRPLHDITAAARRLSDTTLTERIALQGPEDELKELADTFDAMLGRLDSAFRAQKEFVSNASHELRTPLAIIRTELDVTLADPHTSSEDLKQMAATIRDAVTRSDQLIDRLLVLARSGDEVAREPLDLAAIARTSTERYSTEADSRQLGLDLDLKEAPVQGDAVLLERLVDNLVENAILYNDVGGFFRIESGVQMPTAPNESESAWLRVSNGGAHIPAAEVGRLFERFYRLDHSRSRSTGGFGLGLSIVRAVAEAHGGYAKARPLPEGGLQVTVVLPKRLEAPAAALTSHAQFPTGAAPPPDRPAADHPEPTAQA